jgi:hypothetical protein
VEENGGAGRRAENKRDANSAPLAAAALLRSGLHLRWRFELPLRVGTRSTRMRSITVVGCCCRLSHQAGNQSIPPFEATTTRSFPSRMKRSGAVRCLPVFRPVVVKSSTGRFLA